MKTILSIATLFLITYTAWHPMKVQPHQQTKLERQRAVFELYERVRPDFTLKEVQELPMPISYSGDEEPDCK